LGAGRPSKHAGAHLAFQPIGIIIGRSHRAGAPALTEAKMEAIMIYPANPEATKAKKKNE